MRTSSAHVLPGFTLKSSTGACCVLTCDGGEFEQVTVQIDVHARAVVGQGDAGAVPAHRQVLMEAQDQSSQSDLDRLSPGEGPSPPGVIFHQNLQQIDDAGESRINVDVYVETKQCTEGPTETDCQPWFTAFIRHQIMKIKNKKAKVP